MRIPNRPTEDLPLLSTFFPYQNEALALNECKMGIVVCDRRLRYKALSQGVAEIHNVPVRGHLGQSFQQILGSFADKVIPFWENVLSTGQPLCNLEVVGQLPKRSGAGRWIENLFPLEDGRGRITQVGCVVFEVPPISPSSSLANKAISVTGNRHASADRRQRTPLSNREQEVLRLLAEGNSNKEISSLLAISVRTVETYRSRLMLKLQVRSIAHLIHYAIRNRILTL
jgi:DNA-binding CsgD family transcriptional regulator